MPMEEIPAFYVPPAGTDPILPEPPPADQVGSITFPPVEPIPQTLPEPEPAQAEPPAPAVVPPEADPITSALEEIRLQLEEQQIANKLIEKQLEAERMFRDEAASKAGYYKRVATDLAASRRTPEPQAPTGYDDLGDEPAARVAPETARFEAEIQSLREDAVERAQVEALNQFFAANPDAREAVKEMEPFIAQARDRYASWLDSGDPKMIRRAAGMTLDTAYLNAQKARTTAKRTERLTARASQLQRLADEKRAASIPGSGTAAPSGAPQKTLQNMTEAELVAALNSLR